VIAGVDFVVTMLYEGIFRLTGAEEVGLDTALRA
jgi:hypothetical protein